MEQMPSFNRALGKNLTVRVHATLPIQLRHNFTQLLLLIIMAKPQQAMHRPQRNLYQSISTSLFAKAFVITAPAIKSSRKKPAVPWNTSTI